MNANRTDAALARDSYARWGIAHEHAPYDQCTYCGRVGRDCGPVTCLACGTRQCDTGSDCAVCLAGLLRPTHPTGEPRVCGYSGCGAAAVARAPRVGFACGGHLWRPSRTWRGKTISLADDIRSRVAERDNGGSTWRRLAWMGPGDPPHGVAGAFLPDGTLPPRRETATRRRVCRCGHDYGQHEIRGDGSIFACYLWGCPCLDFEVAPPSQRVDGKPETPADKRLFDLREAGYTGPIDQDSRPGTSGPRAEALKTLAVRTAAAAPSFTRIALAQRIAGLSGYLTEPDVTDAAIPADGAGIGGTRAALDQISRTAAEATTTVGHLAMSLADADMDPATLTEVAAILDAAVALRGRAAACLDGLNARHARVEEAINATPHVARLSFYRH
jgi:hypothetical protein